MSLYNLRQKRDYLMDIACDFAYLIATCKYSEFNKNREKELKKLAKRIHKIDEQIENAVAE